MSADVKTEGYYKFEYCQAQNWLIGYIELVTVIIVIFLSTVVKCAIQQFFAREKQITNYSRPVRFS